MWRGDRKSDYKEHLDVKFSPLLAFHLRQLQGLGKDATRNGVGVTDVKAKNALADLKRKNPKYKEQAYLFVLSALHRRLSALPPRHVSGREVANTIREMALERFGPLARTILEHWGIHSTSDMGEIVFALVECGVLIKEPTDMREDFESLFTFEEAFKNDYPWNG